ncbi:hypothetical protein G97194_004745 [Escherichia coli]|nr:hypothetical protein G97194_004745 [Escherichia coli]
MKVLNKTNTEKRDEIAVTRNTKVGTLTHKTNNKCKKKEDKRKVAHGDKVKDTKRKTDSKKNPQIRK